MARAWHCALRTSWTRTVCASANTVSHDLYADQPWAFSPLLSTMYRVQVNRAKEAYQGKSSKDLFGDEAWPAFPTPEGDSEEHFVREDIAPLFLADEEKIDESTGIQENTVKELQSDDANAASRTRASWLGKKANREKVSVTPRDVVTVDFCNGYIDFNTLQLVLPYAGLHFDLQRYWDGQPVRYVCKNLASKEVFFVVQYVDMLTQIPARRARQRRREPECQV